MDDAGSLSVSGYIIASVVVVMMVFMIVLWRFMMLVFRLMMVMSIEVILTFHTTVSADASAR